MVAALWQQTGVEPAGLTATENLPRIVKSLHCRHISTTWRGEGGSQWLGTLHLTTFTPLCESAEIKGFEGTFGCCAFQDPQSAYHSLLLAFQLAEMKTKLDMSERRVGELEEERHRQHPENERLRVLGRERPLRDTVGGCTLLPCLCSGLKAALPFSSLEWHGMGCCIAG